MSQLNRLFIVRAKDKSTVCSWHKHNTWQPISWYRRLVACHGNQQQHHRDDQLTTNKICWHPKQSWLVTFTLQLPHPKQVQSTTSTVYSTWTYISTSHSPNLTSYKVHFRSLIWLCVMTKKVSLRLNRCRASLGEWWQHKVKPCILGNRVVSWSVSNGCSFKSLHTIKTKSLFILCILGTLRVARQQFT